MFIGTVRAVNGADADGLGVPSQITYDISYTDANGLIRLLSNVTPPRTNFEPYGDMFGLRAITPGTTIVVIERTTASVWFPMEPEWPDIQPCEQEPTP